MIDAAFEVASRKHEADQWAEHATSGEPAQGKHSFGLAVCEALGLSGKLVTSLKLHVSVDSLVTVTVTRLATRDEARKLVEVFQRHHFISTPKEA